LGDLELILDAEKNSREPFVSFVKFNDWETGETQDTTLLDGEDFVCSAGLLMLT